MSATYPEPETPLPWASSPIGYSVMGIDGKVARTLSLNDTTYIVHAANAFPHLVAALEATLPMLTKAPGHRDMIAHALAIARGETPP